MHLKELIPNENKGLVMANRISVVIGFISSFGLTIVGNFQVINNFIDFLLKNNYFKLFTKVTNVRLVHLVGAFMAFIGLLVYNWVQTFMANILNASRLFLFRIIMCIIASLNLILSKTI